MVRMVELEVPHCLPTAFPLQPPVHLWPVSTGSVHLLVQVIS
jgi:hypothetical protein